MQWYERIKARRDELNLSQAALARKVGVSQALIGKLETGNLRNTQYLLPILEALDFPEKDIQELFNVVSTSERLSPHEQRLFNINPRTVIELMHPRLSQERDYILDPGRHELIPCPQELSTAIGAHAVSIISDEMEPEFEPGDTAYINPVLPPLINTTGFLARQRAGDTFEAYRMVRLIGSTPTAWVIKRWNQGTKSGETQELTFADWPRYYRCSFRGLRR